MKSLREYALIALVLWLDTVSFAAYFFASRAYVRDSLGELEAYRYVALLVGFEGIASLAAPLGGVLGDVYGRRAVALLSLLRAPVYLSIPIVTAYDPRLLFVPAFVGGVFSNIFYSNALGVLLHRARGSGRVYATVTMVFPLAWSVGSVIPGLLEPLGGYTLIFSSVGATALLASLLLALLGDNNSSGARYRDALDSLSALPKSLLAGLLLAGAGLTLYWNLLSIKLYEVTESLLVFGLVGGTLTTIASTIARPIAGVVADKLNPVRLLTVAYAAYLVYGLLLYHVSGLLFLALWVLPLYPFREIAQTMAVSRSLPRSLQNTAAGVVTLTYSLPATAYPLFYMAGYGLEEGLLVYVATLAISVLVLLTRIARESGGG